MLLKKVIGTDKGYLNVDIRSTGMGKLANA